MKILMRDVDIGRILLLAVGAVLLACMPASAASKDFELFLPTPIPEGGIQVQAPRVPGRLLSAGTYLQLQGSPVRLYDSKGKELATPVPYRLQLRVVGGYTFLKRFMVGLDLPVSLAQSVMTVPNGKKNTGPAMNDMILKGRATILDKPNGALGAGVDIRLNTGNGDALGGLDGRFAEAAFWVLGEYDIQQVFLRINGGYQERSLTKIPEFNLIRDDLIYYRLGAGYRIKQDINNVFLEFADSTDVANFDTKYGYQNEIFAGYQHQLGPVVLGPGAALGIGKGYGTPLYRILAMAWYTLPANDTAVDADDDNAINWLDKCPNESEDHDTYADDDGCPETDADNDGVLDEVDACATSSEDIDSFEDHDGCPDPDNDKDQIVDGADSCPNEVEDTDGFEDSDGCPDPDNDHDQVLDTADQCPAELEVHNNYFDTDGCSDNSTTHVYGVVTDIATGAPIEGANVTLVPPGGMLVFEPAAATAPTTSTEAPITMASESSSVDVTADESATPGTQSVALDSGVAAHHAAAQELTTLMSPPLKGKYTTGADGRFEFATQISGSAQLRVQATDYLEATFALDVPQASAVTYAVSLEKPKGKIQVTETNLTVDPIFFVAGKATIEKRSAESLDVLAQYMRLNPTVSLSIEGHTDDKGDGIANAKLSSRRAAAVADALVDRGIDVSRLTSIGYGEDRPLVSNDSETNRAQNRRVEFILKR